MKVKLIAYLSSRAAYRTALLSLTVAVVLVIVFVAGIAYMRSDVSAASASRSDVTTPSILSENQDRVETELITLQQTGFEPNEIRRPRGAFILGVDNRSGVEAIELRLVRTDGQPLNALLNARRKTSWRDVVDLAPGQYVLSEANHSDWTCTVTILPR